MNLFLNKSDTPTPPLPCPLPNPAPRPAPRPAHSSPTFEVPDGWLLFLML